jgi:hypothetical protein
LFKHVPRLYPHACSTAWYSSQLTVRVLLLDPVVPLEHLLATTTCVECGIGLHKLRPVHLCLVVHHAVGPHHLAAAWPRAHHRPVGAGVVLTGLCCSTNPHAGVRTPAANHPRDGVARLLQLNLTLLTPPLRLEPTTEATHQLPARRRLDVTWRFFYC